MVERYFGHGFVGVFVFNAPLATELQKSRHGKTHEQICGDGGGNHLKTVKNEVSQEYVNALYRA